MPATEIIDHKTLSPIPFAEVEIDNLPRDPDLLTGIIRELVANLKQALSLNEKQKHQLEQLLKARYGARSEKFNPDHLPLNRMEGIFERHGVEIARPTMCAWMASAANLALPVYDLMKSRILSSKKINTDDTTVQVLDRTLPKTKTGRMWIYLGDDDHAFNVFDYSANRKRDHPMKFLAGYRGYLQADAYAGYDAIYAGRAVTEAACMAHARRKYVEAQGTDPTNAAIAISWIRRRYDVEDEARGLSPPDRERLRNEKSRPIMDDFGKWLDAASKSLLPKSPMGQAIQYTLWNWKALRRYLEYGALEIDNNAAERALRSIAIGRKNWMFAGSDNGGKTAAVLFSMTSTCKRHGIDPFAYMRDLFARISAHPSSRIDEFLPDVWKTLPQAEHIEKVA